ncbi:MAG TPA: pyridoxamine 5'-phosphate oxidase family protein [Streptosporangiaceae bacterium]|nr:pyridoxamine 5'-phosphate oxidase family protein [Streptosporangiaceae bacterium]
MTGITGIPGWHEMELDAPEIARLGIERLSAARLAMLGTIRRDGSPRISPIEPYILDGGLLVGAMTWSAKAADLRRDPRYVLHSAVTSPDSGEGELKLYGRAVAADAALRTQTADAWWAALPPDKAIVFALAIAQALFVSWDLEGGVMTVHRWSARDGYSCSARTYP